MKKPNLIDMDGVVFDFVHSLYKLAALRDPYLASLFPDRKLIRDHYVEKSFDMSIPEDIRKQMAELIVDVVNDDPIFAYAPLIQDAVSGIRYLEKQTGRPYFYCSNPHVPNILGWSHKAMSLEDLIGKDESKKMILTKDKTLVSGVLLIDDAPTPIGVYTPDWIHIVFDQPWNDSASSCADQTSGKYRLMNWKESSIDDLLTQMEKNGIAL